MGNTAPLGALLVSWEAITSKGGKGEIFKLTLDLFELQIKSKKK